MNTDKEKVFQVSGCGLQVSGSVNAVSSQVPQTRRLKPFVPHLRPSAFIRGFRNPLARLVFSFFLFPFSFFLLRFACAGDAVPGQTPRGAADPVEAHLKAGRDCFQKKEYAAALEKFSRALDVKPAHREARFLAGLAAYWAKRPAKALEFWNALLDSTPRNSAEEWRLETNRVMALSALSQLEAAEQVVGRIYELRQKVVEARRAGGFVREHFQAGDFRLGCWELFDERRESQELWSFPVVALGRQDEPIVACLAVLAALLPGDKPGFVLNEEGPGYTLVYKHWTERPGYSEVRAVLLEVLQGKLKPLEEKRADNADTFPAAAAGFELPWHGSTGSPRQRLAVAPPKQRVFSEAEQALAAKVQAFGLDPQATEILTLAARLKDVEFDVTMLTRLSLRDQLLAERRLEGLNAQAPFAKEDAAELVELVSKAKAEQVRAACEKLSRLGARQPYLDYALLTAFTTRGHDVPVALLKELLKSRDFMVRQTAALLLARAGDLRGLAQLFKELENADALGCTILQGSIEEFVSPGLGAPPAAHSAFPGAGLNADEEVALKIWQQKASAWWKENGGKLKFADGQWTAPGKNR